MPTLKQTLSYLILGQKGGKNRIQIIDLLNERPYNLNQLAEELDVNYRTVKHHIDILVKNELVSSSKAGGSGEVYFLTPEMESNMALFNNLVKRLSDITSLPGFFQNILEQSNVSVIIIDKNYEVLFWNIASEELFGYNEDEVIGSRIPVFENDNTCNEILNKCSNGEQIGSLETTLMHKSGSQINISLAVDSITNENNDLIGFSMLCRDISDLKQTVDELRENAERYKSVLADCCPEKLDDDVNEEIDEPEVVPEGPSCPVNYSIKKEQEKKSDCCSGKHE